MLQDTAIGIIDIGSNTVRLAVYRFAANGAYRVVDQGRWAARLSQRVTAEGNLPDDAVDELAEVLMHFRRICSKHGTRRIRTIATAAIRQSLNRESVVRRLNSLTGLTIEILSGEDEARIGSRAMLGSLGIEDGFVVDIGGGSTEISLIRGRRRHASVSYPIGCVNMFVRYKLGDKPVSEASANNMTEHTRKLLAADSWLSSRPGLPLIGLGGTVRALAKLHQRQTDYPFSQLHGYELQAQDVEQLLAAMMPLDADERRKLPGLSRDRADVIVPGLAILRGVLEHTGAAPLVVCGAGLRDGLFAETCLPEISDVLEESVCNLNALYPGAPPEHLEQVRKLTLALYDRLAPGHRLPAWSRRLLETAARLFRIGAVIDYNDAADHTFYMLLHTHWNGLSHREMLLTAAIASYDGTGSLRRKLAPYRLMLEEGDQDAIVKLAMLLQLAAALDRSESQAIARLELKLAGDRLEMIARCAHPLPVERVEVETIAREIKKSWGVTPQLSVLTHS